MTPQSLVLRDDILCGSRFNLTVSMTLSDTVLWDNGLGVVGTQKGERDYARIR